MSDVRPAAQTFCGGFIKTRLLHMNNTRLQKELKEVLASQGAGIGAYLVDGDIKHWKGSLNGPDDTPYAGGRFVVDIIIPPNYPFEPPKMKFDTKIWHPNMSSQTGAICLDILKNEWSPALTIRTALLSLQALLCNPEPDDPQDAVVAGMYKRDRPEFNRTAKEWTSKYAVSEEALHQAKVVKLMEMGFGEAQVRAALQRCNWNEEQALEAIMSSM